MIIRAEIADYDVGRVLIDTGSWVNVIFADAFKGLGIADSMVNRQITPLLSFSGDLVQPVGSISLPIAFGVAPRKTMTYDQFLIVDCPTAYNVIVGRTALTRVKAHLSPHMLLMKFPTRNGTGVIRGDQLSARTCYATALKSVASKPPMEAMTLQGLPNSSELIDDPREENPTPMAQPAEELETVILNEEFPDRWVKIGTNLDMPGLMTICLAYHLMSSATSSASPPPTNRSGKSADRTMPNGTRQCVPRLTSSKPSALLGKLRTLFGLPTQSWFGKPGEDGGCVRTIPT
ncbi:unnamed protein product [Prunus armeniaca]